MHKLVGSLVQQMGNAYPELGQAKSLIEETLLQEETRFRQTLDRGLKLLDEELARVPEGEELSGKTAFKLYDTYGFPLDLTQDALREKGRRLIRLNSTLQWRSRKLKRVLLGWVRVK
ncbi:MAG: hypothetical protein CM15mP85_12180 [Rhodobacterales bacterium]|nr:MAG: hypothetical protein CM15mP85_12180 [Rhodobacterales bacterium]